MLEFLRTLLDKEALEAVNQPPQQAMHERRQVTVSLREALTRHEALLALLQAFNADEPLDDLLQNVVDTVAAVLPADAVLLFRLDLVNALVLDAKAGGACVACVQGVSYEALMEGLTGQVMFQQEPVVVRQGDATAPEQDEGLFQGMDIEGGSMIVVPMTYKGRLIGTLAAANRPGQSVYTASDVELLVALANQAAGAIENGRLIEAQRVSEARLRTLYHATTQRAGSFTEQISSVLSLATDMLGLEVGILSHIEDQRYTVEACSTGGLALGQTFELGQTYCSITLMESDVLAIDCMGRSVYQRHACYEAFQVESYIGLGIVVDGKPYGTLNFSSSTPRRTPFTESDKDFIRLLGRWVAFTIEHAQAEKALWESRQFLDSIIDNIPDMVFVKDARDLRFVRCNKAVLEACGMTLDDIVGKTDFDFFPEALAEANRAADREVLSNNRIHEAEEPHIDGEGRPRYMYIKKVPILDPDGEPQYLLGIAEDITERKLAQKTLRRSEGRFRSAFDYAAVGMGLVAPDGRWLEVNQSLCRILGYREEEFLKKTFQNITHPDDLDADLAYVEQMLRGEIKSYQMEKRYYHKAGHVVWALLSVSAVWSDQDEVVYFVAQIQDITERKASEAALRAGEMRLELALRGADLGLWDWNVETGAVVYNERWAEMLGYTLDELEPNARTLQRLAHPDDLERIIEEVSANVLGRAEFFELEYRLRAKSGEWRWILGRGKVVERAPNGHAVRATGTHLDITERKQAEEALALHAEELARSNAELEQFAYVASHDLQEPLRKIQAFGDRIAGKYGEALDERGLDYLQRMQNAAARMQTLINDLLALSRVTSRARSFVAVDLGQVVADVLSDLEHQIERTEGRVEVERLPVVEADPAQMRQLFQNLIGNALKFHRPGVAPVVHVAARAVGGGLWQVEVRDNGIGFDQQYADRIFKPFQRLHGRSAYEGTGIGLALCRKIVERHGGRIAAKSRTGQGTRFAVCLHTEAAEYLQGP